MRFFLILGCILGGLSVGLGAFGAHILKPIINDYGLALWEKGTYYQMVHAIMLIVTSVLILQFKTDHFFRIASTLFLIGIILFSGSLYIIALSGIRSFGMIAPFGGISFMSGWLCLMIGVIQQTKVR